MTTGKALPSIVQYMIMRRRAHIDCQDLGQGCPCGRFTSRYQVWSRSSHSILDHIGNKRCQGDADDKPQDSDVSFMEARSDYDGVEDEEYQWTYAGVYDVLKGRDSFDEGVRVTDCVVVEGEEAVEGSYEEAALRKESVQDGRGRTGLTPKYASCRRT